MAVSDLPAERLGLDKLHIDTDTIFKCIAL